MKLVDYTIRDYLNILKSNEPAPGGGSVSALTGAQGAALLLMVCNLTIGREKYAAYENDCLQAKKKGEAILESLTKAIDEDTEAFRLVSAAFKMSKDTEEEKQARSKAIAAATLTATEVPFSVMETAMEGLMATAALVGKSNPSAVSDLGSAAASLLACAKGAWLNVAINLPGIKDPAKAEYFDGQGKKILADAERLAAEVFTEVAEVIK